MNRDKIIENTAQQLAPLLSDKTWFCECTQERKNDCDCGDAMLENSVDRYDDDWDRASVRRLARKALEAYALAIPGLADVLDGKATIIPNKIGKEDAEGIWEAAYNVWAEFGASDAEAGQAAHDAIIAISPYAKEPDHGPV